MLVWLVIGGVIGYTLCYLQAWVMLNDIREYYEE